MKKIYWGIIGCGNVTEVKSGPAFNLVPDSELVAVMRRDAVKAKDYALRHKVEKWHSDAAELIDDKDVNAIYIATPPAYHEAYALQAFRAGKSVYLEKPMALDAVASDRINKAADAYSCRLTIAHYRRAQAKFQKILQIIKDGSIGDIISADLQFHQAYQPGTENTWRVNPAISGGGLFHDLAPHQLDLMILYFGYPLSVKGISTNRANLYNADDYVHAEMLFENGIRFTGEWDFNARSEDERDVCRVKGTRGSIYFSVFGSLCRLETGGQVLELKFDHLPHVQQPMIDQVVQYFLDNRKNPCPAADAVEVMRIIDGITLSKSS